MRPLLVALSLVGLSFGLTSAARADVAPPQPAPAPPPEALEGELRIALKNAEYVKVHVNGEEWETFEFERKGKDLIIKNLNLSQDRNAIVLTPSDSALAPLTVDVMTTEFKRQRQGRFVVMVARKTVTFAKAPPVDPGVVPGPNKDPKPKQDPIAPPPEKKDDL